MAIYIKIAERRVRYDEDGCDCDKSLLITVIEMTRAKMIAIMKKATWLIVSKVLV